MKQPHNLFFGTDWRSVEQKKKSQIENEIKAIEGNDLLNTSLRDLCLYFEKNTV